MARQKEILGMRIQREYKGPAARLVDLLDSNDRSYVGVVFYEEYRNHSAITNSLDGLMEFLQCPVARGITPLHSYGYDEGAFIYETGKCKSLAELIRQASDLGLSPGPRAGLEMMTQALEVLDGAIQIAEEYAIYSHGGLTPWRLMIRPDGKLQIIGFAVPQVEVLDFKSNPELVPSEDSFRYAPPERMMLSEIEDFSSDLFALGLIAFELMTTRPMYDGSTSAIQEAAQRADVSMKLNQAMMSGWFDQYTHDFLDSCLRLDSTDRYSSLSEALQAGKNLLRNPHLQGMSLFDLMSASNQHILRQSQDVEVLEGATAMFDRSSINEELLAREQERKRQKLANVTISESEKSEGSTVKNKRTPIVEAPPKRPSTDNLLDLLRQSTIANVEEAPEPEEPKQDSEPEEVPPMSSTSSSLLSALRSSIATDASEVPHTEESDDSERDAVEDSSTKRSESVKGRSDVANKLSSLISTPKRSFVPPSVESTVSELVEEGKSKKSTETQGLSNDEPSEKTSRARPSVSSKEPDEPPMLGDALPMDDELFDDDGATAVMMRPIPPRSTKSKSQNVQKASSSQSSPSRATTKNSPPETEDVSTQTTTSKQSVNSIESNPQIPPTLTGQVQSIYEPPVPIRMSIPSANAVKYQISLGLGRGTIKQTVSPEATVSQVVSLLLLNRLLPVRTDLMGNLTSCYRFMEKGEPCSGRRSIKSFKSRKLQLGSIPSRILMCTIQVDTEEGSIYFNTPVNWIVPISSLLDHIVSWLRLSGTDWKMSVGEEQMNPHDVLFDVVESERNIVLRVHQKRA